MKKTPKKPYLVSLTSYVYGLKENYERTLFKLKDSVIPIQVGFSPYPYGNKNIKQLTVCEAYPGNLSRFNYFPKGFEDDDMIIFTDTSDVIFQCPMPKLDKNVIYVAPEFTTWNSEGNYWNQYLDFYDCHELDGLMVFCMGCWAMSYKKVKDLLQFMESHKAKFGEWEQCDQILFNLWLKQYPSVIEHELFPQLYDGYFKGKVVKKNGKFYDSLGFLLPIVHANGQEILKSLLVQKKK